MAGEHASLSASGAKRWMSCPGSVFLESLFNDIGSSYAEEGTNAHTLAEQVLRRHLAKLDETPSQHVDTEMSNYVNEYVRYCLKLYNDAISNTGHCYAFIEERVNYDNWTKGGFGTVDLCLIYGKHVDIIDFKYGKGVLVNVSDNPQLQIYALGVYQEYGHIFDIETVTLHIVQPRLDNTNSIDLSMSELLDWGKNELLPASRFAVTATSELALGKQSRLHSPFIKYFNSGTWCQFCKARALCMARASYMINIAFKAVTYSIGG
jgi:hypothetical protein